MKYFFVTSLILGLATPVANAALYKWLDEEGGVHFSDQPPPTNIRKFETGRSRRGQKTDPTVELPYALQEPVKNFPVVLYISACGGPCDVARLLLKKRGIPYSEKDAGDPAIQAEMTKLLGGDTVVVPLMTVGRALQRGYEENAWNNALDTAGYPKTSVLPPGLAVPSRPAAAPNKAVEDTGKESKDGDLPAKKSAGQYPVAQ